MVNVLVIKMFGFGSFHKDSESRGLHQARVRFLGPLPKIAKDLAGLQHHH